MILCSAEPRIISCLPTHVINLVINDNSLEILYILYYIIYYYIIMLCVLYYIILYYIILRYITYVCISDRLKRTFIMDAFSLYVCANEIHFNCT